MIPKPRLWFSTTLAACAVLVCLTPSIAYAQDDPAPGTPAAPDSAAPDSAALDSAAPAPTPAVRLHRGGLPAVEGWLVDWVPEVYRVRQADGTIVEVPASQVRRVDFLPEPGARVAARRGWSLADRARRSSLVAGLEELRWKQHRLSTKIAKLLGDSPETGLRVEEGQRLLVDVERQIADAQAELDALDQDALDRGLIFDENTLRAVPRGVSDLLFQREALAEEIAVREARPGTTVQQLFGLRQELREIDVRLAHRMQQIEAHRMQQIEVRKAANEAEAIAALRELVTVQGLFRDTDGSATTTEDGSEKQGYKFENLPEGFEASLASPLGKPGRKFFVDEKGVIRFTDNPGPKPAPADAPTEAVAAPSHPEPLLAALTDALRTGEIDSLEPFIDWDLDEDSDHAPERADLERMLAQLHTTPVRLPEVTIARAAWANGGTFRSDGLPSENQWLWLDLRAGKRFVFSMEGVGWKRDRYALRPTLSFRREVDSGEDHVLDSFVKLIRSAKISGSSKRITPMLPGYGDYDEWVASVNKRVAALHAKHPDFQWARAELKAVAWADGTPFFGDFPPPTSRDLDLTLTSDGVDLVVRLHGLQGSEVWTWRHACLGFQTAKETDEDGDERDVSSCPTRFEVIRQTAPEAETPAAPEADAGADEAAAQAPAVTPRAVTPPAVAAPTVTPPAITPPADRRAAGNLWLATHDDESMFGPDAITFHQPQPTPMDAWSYENGILTGKTAAALGRYGQGAIAGAGESTWKDYVFEVDYLVVKGAFEVGVRFNTDESAFVLLTPEVKADGKWRTLEISCRGGSFEQLQSDGTWKEVPFDAHDSTQGGIAFVLGAYSEVKFKDLKVKVLPDELCLPVE